MDVNISRRSSPLSTKTDAAAIVPTFRSQFRAPSCSFHLQFLGVVHSSRSNSSCSVSVQFQFPGLVPSPRSITSSQLQFPVPSSKFQIPIPCSSSQSIFRLRLPAPVSGCEFPAGVPSSGSQLHAQRQSTTVPVLRSSSQFLLPDPPSSCSSFSSQINFPIPVTASIRTSEFQNPNSQFGFPVPIPSRLY